MVGNSSAFICQDLGIITVALSYIRWEIMLGNIFTFLVLVLFSDKHALEGYVSSAIVRKHSLFKVTVKLYTQYYVTNSIGREDSVTTIYNTSKTIN